MLRSDIDGSVASQVAKPDPDGKVWNFNIGTDHSCIRTDRRLLQLEMPR